VTRVLVVDKLASFLEQEAVPDDIEAVIFRESDGIPAGEFTGIIPVVTTRVGAHDLDRNTGLKVIANYGVGYDNIDIAAARARSIAVSNTPGVLTDATAELTIALMFAVARRIGEGERMVRARAWTGWTPTQLRGIGLSGRTLGLVGAGRIGRAVGTRAAALGMRVCYWNRRRHEAWEGSSGARLVELDVLLSSSDVVSIHLAAAKQTAGLIDARALSLMKDGALLINTARGAMIDESALIEQLKSRRLHAGLDVYVDEPNVRSELLELENVVLLPHIGSATYEARQAMWDTAWRNLMLGIAGKPLADAV
jgi:glyoxylate reductase